jgi:hypothetical protein
MNKQLDFVLNGISSASKIPFNNYKAVLQQRGIVEGPSVKGSIQGTHYDPESAIANRGQSKKRPAPLHSGGG